MTIEAAAALPLDDRELTLRAIIGADGINVVDQCHDRLRGEWKQRAAAIAARTNATTTDTKQSQQHGDDDDDNEHEHEHDDETSEDGSGDDKTGELLTLLDQLRRRLTLSSSSSVAK